MTFRASQKPVILAALLVTIPAIDCLVALSGIGRIYSNPFELPARRVSLVLGTSNYLVSGQPSPWFVARMEAAAELYIAGRTQYIIVSGDNSTESYNEPARMQESLVRMGVPLDRIILDYAGFSTLDSVVRARVVFGQSRLIIVSQDFQNERALFLASFSGVDAVAYNARNMGGVPGFNMNIREGFARFKAFLDIFYINTQPHFLGRPIRIP